MNNRLDRINNLILRFRRDIITIILRYGAWNNTKVLARVIVIYFRCIVKSKLRSYLLAPLLLAFVFMKLYRYLLNYRILSAPT